MDHTTDQSECKSYKAILIVENELKRYSSQTYLFNRITRQFHPLHICGMIMKAFLFNNLISVAIQHCHYSGGAANTAVPRTYPIRLLLMLSVQKEGVAADQQTRLPFVRKNFFRIFAAI